MFDLGFLVSIPHRIFLNGSWFFGFICRRGTVSIPHRIFLNPVLRRRGGRELCTVSIPHRIFLNVACLKLRAP